MSLAFSVLYKGFRYHIELPLPTTAKALRAAVRAEQPILFLWPFRLYIAGARQPRDDNEIFRITWDESRLILDGDPVPDPERGLVNGVNIVAVPAPGVWAVASSFGLPAATAAVAFTVREGLPFAMFLAAILAAGFNVNCAILELRRWR